jgi:hypothetical protein
LAPLALVTLARELLGAQREARLVDDRPQRRVGGDVRTTTIRCAALR